MDKFKKIVKDKVQFDPMHTTRDQDIWNKLDTQIAAHEAARNPWKRYYAYAAAASVVLCVGLAFLIFKAPAPQVAEHTSVPSDTAAIRSPQAERSLTQEAAEPSVQNKPEAATATRQTQPSFVTQAQATTLAGSKPEYFELADGSVVALDKGSSLVLNPTYTQQREVQLSGEGYFEVAHDPSHPFKVYFANTHLVVLGTKFYVQGHAGSKTQKVSVLQGKVKVYNPAERSYTVLGKGQELLLINDKQVQFHASISNPIGAWKKGSLVFSDTPLSKVFFTLAKANGQAITYNAPIATCVFSGDLSGMSLSEALNLIKITANLVIEEKDDHIYVSGTSCE